MAVRTFEELFVDELKDIYDAEKRLTKALPKMIKSANSQELSSGLQEHLKETEGHVQRLDRIFEMLDESPGRKVCQGIVGLLAEGDALMEELKDQEDLLDAGIIAAAQKVEHYEMATYGTLREWARLLGREEIAEMLQQTLEEEGAADRKLNRLAEDLNIEASSDDEADETEDEEVEESGTVNAPVRASKTKATTNRRR